MKCDELKKKYSDITGPYYGYNEVNEAIAELKAASTHTDNSAVIENMATELEHLRPMETALELAEADNKGYLARIKELEAEVKAKEKWDKEPKAVRDEFFRKVLVYGADLVRVEDAFILAKDNRRLERALWLARAELCRRFDVDRYLRNHRSSLYNEDTMELKMCKAESKCRAKAEEYK